MVDIPSTWFFLLYTERKRQQFDFFWHSGAPFGYLSMTRHTISSASSLLVRVVLERAVSFYGYFPPPLGCFKSCSASGPKFPNVSAT
jgi:hypothetical protein